MPNKILNCFHCFPCLLPAPQGGADSLPLPPCYEKKQAEKAVKPRFSYQ